MFRPLARAPRWQPLWGALRLVGLVLLLVAFFAPLPLALLVAVAVPGLALFLFGAFAWLLRTEEPWLRRGV